MNTLCSLDTGLDLEAEGGWNIEKISGADIAAEWEYGQSCLHTLASFVFLFFCFAIIQTFWLSFLEHDRMVW